MKRALCNWEHWAWPHQFLCLISCWYFLFQKMSDKCFKKCVAKPGTSLDSSEQARIVSCCNLLPQNYAQMSRQLCTGREKWKSTAYAVIEHWAIADSMHRFCQFRGTYEPRHSRVALWSVLLVVVNALLYVASCFDIKQTSVWIQDRDIMQNNLRDVMKVLCITTLKPQYAHSACHHAAVFSHIA